jgi:hypothetical protein
MEPIKAITVTLQMDSGELRAGLKLRALFSRDTFELGAMIDLAKRNGLYAEDTGILAWNALGGLRLNWADLGARSRRDFSKM